MGQEVYAYLSNLTIGTMVLYDQHASYDIYGRLLITACKLCQMLSQVV